MAGLSAAAWSVRQGRSVVLVEKGEMGGTAIHAGFIWTAPTVDVLREQVPDGDPDLQARLIEDFPAAIEWVRSLEVECLPAVTVLRFGKGHQTDMTNYLRFCEEIIRADEGSEIILHGEAQRLLIEGGEVRGAEIKLPSGELREVRASSTLLATGGFGADPEQRAARIHPQARNIPVRGNWYSRGDGLRLGQSAGGQFGDEDAGFYGHLLPAGVKIGENDDFVGLALYYSEHAVLLNLQAERFIDETVGDHLTTIALVRQPEARGLLISDARVREEYIMRPYVEGVVPVDTFDRCFKRGARCAIAQDIDELAHVPEDWGYDGEAVRQALLDFNQQCVEGTLDPPRQYDAVPINTPPFYVIEAVPGISFSFGGLRIDSEAHVVDGRGEPIPGLLAAGADAGGVYTRAYAGGIAAALVFGLRAARTAMEVAAVPAH
jgi:succinate dehydrogenase/fumarate reductase flavoprotein subunit